MYERKEIKLSCSTVADVGYIAEWRVRPATILDFRRDRTGKAVE